MIDEYEERSLDKLYGRISLRRLTKMLRKYTKKRPNDGWYALGKVWLSTGKRGYLHAAKLKLAILEIESPKTESTIWVIRGLVCETAPLVWRHWEYGTPYEILYDPEERVGTEKKWWEPFQGFTTESMEELTMRLAG